MSARDELAARLLATFSGELTEQVRVLNEELLALERKPTAPDHLRAVFRIAHTLKGAARAASVPGVEQVCHEVEGMLAAARDGGVQLAPASFEVNEKLALVAFVGLFADAVIAVSGAVVSTTQVNDAGLGSMFPAESMARTSNVCEPSESPV